MDKLSICFAGLSRQEEAELTSLFKQANAQRGNRWLVAPEAEAGALVIDMDSMYGQMSLMKALGTGKKLVALTSGGRADTDYKLMRPVTAAAMGELLAAMEGGAATSAPAAAAPADTPPPAAAPATSAPAPAATPASASAPAAATPVDQSTKITAELPAAPATPVPAAAAPAPAPAPTPGPAPATAPAPAPAPTPAPAATRTLADYLRPGAFTGPMRIKHGDAPEIVLDPESQTWLGGNALKPLMPYGAASLQDSEFTPVPAADLAALEAKNGGRQPYSRLAWLLALAGGSGALMPGFNPNEKYKLLKWPQTEREFPKHFRIATVMMKGPALLTEIAEASGVGLDEVIDYVNASLAVGVAEPESGAIPVDAAKGGGLLGRFRR